MTLKKYNPESDKMSKRTYNELVNKSQETVAFINKHLAQGYDKAQITSLARQEFGLTNKQAGTYVDAVIEVAYCFSPDYAAEVIAQARLAINQTLRQIEAMYEDADKPRDQAQALVLKLKALQQLRDLAPKQVQLQTIQMQEEEVKRTLFEIHGIEIDDGTVVEVEF